MFFPVKWYIPNWQLILKHAHVSTGFVHLGTLACKNKSIFFRVGYWDRVKYWYLVLVISTHSGPLITFWDWKLFSWFLNYFGFIIAYRDLFQGWVLKWLLFNKKHCFPLFAHCPHVSEWDMWGGARLATGILPIDFSREGGKDMCKQHLSPGWDWLIRRLMVQHNPWFKCWLVMQINLIKLLCLSQTWYCVFIQWVGGQVQET